MTTDFPRIRVVAAMVVAFVPAATIAVTAVMYHDRLPGLVPVHWSGLGEPDRFASTGSLLRWTLATAVLAGAVTVGAVAAIRRRASAAGLVGLAAGLGGVAGATWVTSTATTLSTADSSAARLGWHVVWVPAAIAWAAAYSWFVGRTGRLPGSVPASGTAGPAGRVASARTAWVSVLRSGMFVTVPLIAAGVVVVVGVTVEPLVLPFVAVPVAVLLLFSDLRVIVDRRGLRLVAGPFATPLKRVPLADIALAEAAHIDPLKWGGWGYRVVPGRSALVLRTGPGLVLHLNDGRRFAVTVDHPEAPAALLARLREGNA